MSKTSARYSRVFVPCQHFKPSLIFVTVDNMKSQVDSGLNHKHLTYSNLQNSNSKTPRLAHNCWTGVEVKLIKTQNYSCNRFCKQKNFTK
jgi:hypothetical protein